MSFEKNIGKALNIFEETPKEEVLPPTPEDDAFLEDDYEYARTNLREIIDASQGEIHSILDIARKSESPRAYEVAANLIRTLAETNKDLMKLAKDRKDIRTTPNQNETKGGVTNNNLFVGKTSDLQDFIESRKKKEDE